MEQGIPEENVLMPSIGDIIDIGVQRSRIHGSVPHGSVLVDGLTVGKVNSVVLRDRRAFAAEGILIASVVVDRTTGRPISTPEIIARGLPCGDRGASRSARRSASCACSSGCGGTKWSTGSSAT